MKTVLTVVPVQEAYDDFLRRTLAKIPCGVARLIYLASMRDYNTGKYRHDGLAARFSADDAGEALEMAHREIFYAVAALPLANWCTRCRFILNLRTKLSPTCCAPGGASNPIASPFRWV